MFGIQHIGGVLPALATPLLLDGQLDVAGMRRLVRFVLDAGVHGLVPLGSTGEGALLEERARRTAVEVVAAEAAGRVPLVMGIEQPTPDCARVELRAAASAGASAVLLAPPAYIPLDQPALLRFYRDMAAATSLPILVYNIPQFTKVSMHPSTMAALVEEGAVAGIKDSSGDFNYHSRLLAAMRNQAGVRVFTGAETMLLASLLMGSVGTICGCANVVPALCVQLFNAYHGADLETARSSQFTLLELANALLTGTLPAGFKAALRLMGLCGATLAAPVAALTAEQEQAVERALTRAGVRTGVAAAR
ncbi:MAG: dihydrodipicolinate synthase family protein [Chloroflexota bacterium]